MNIQPFRHPIVITCMIDDDAAIYFNGLRRRHFPTSMNLLKAHLTLFHKILLPAEEVLDAVNQVIIKTEPFKLLAKQIAFTGRGVACVINSTQLIGLHKMLQQSFGEVLTTQDNQVLWPHITIQNKVSAKASKALADALQLKFKPFTFTALGLQLFYYMNGPWKFIADLNFK